MLDALRRARQELDESISPFLDTDPPDVHLLARLHELAGQNAQSARLILRTFGDQASGDLLQDLLRGKLEGVMAYFEEVAAGLAARIEQAGREGG